jgi:uncharacterized protein (TIGR02646 family)
MDFADAAKAFTEDNPVGSYSSEGKRWEAFRNEQQKAYRAARESLYLNQYGLCAYCEIALDDSNQQIEHIIPKSLSSSGQDKTLDFANFVLCCKGGTQQYTATDGAYSDNPSAKANRSCGEKKGDTDPGSQFVSPYQLPELPLFSPDFHPTDGLSLVVDEEACARESIDPKGVQWTMDVLGLNCPRLKRNRKVVWLAILRQLQEIYALPQNERTAALQDLADEHLAAKNTTLPEYITIRRLALL